jgi:hypothetical protein
VALALGGSGIGPWVFWQREFFDRYSERIAS